MNDVSARDLQFQTSQWTLGKAADTFAPLGPVLLTADEVPDPQDLRITTRLNGEVVQDASTSEMIFGVARIISSISRSITLECGDVIATGTPEGVGYKRNPPRFLTDGDVVEIDVSGIGTLSNPVRWGQSR
jgi:2-keto-4-pentenoate hydratase/2-oxohepta-3-ene-1,7-dioic acid hydratase in catechol pathway